MPHSAKNQDPQMAKEVKRFMYTFLINAIEICRDCLHNNYIDYIAQHFDCFNLRNSLLARRKICILYVHTKVLIG